MVQSEKLKAAVKGRKIVGVAWHDLEEFPENVYASSFYIELDNGSVIKFGACCTDQVSFEVIPDEAPAAPTVLERIAAALPGAPEPWEPTAREIDERLDQVLRAAGSRLHHYSLPKTLADMRAAMARAMKRGD